MDLKGSIVSGVFWNSIQVIVNRSFSFFIQLVLARILYPEEFGLIGMAVVFTSFIQVFNDLGFGAALIQRREEDLKEYHYHTSFWTGISWSVIMYAIIFFVVAPFAADFYDEPLIGRIVPIMSLSILVSPINLVHKAQLTKALQFRKLTLVNNVSSILSGLISLCLAFFGWGVWALVFNATATYIIAMPLYFYATRWIPKMIWRKSAFYDVFGFGVNTMGTQVFNNLINKFDYLIIGKMLSASALGGYSLAFTLTDTFRSQLMSIMNNVMYPVYGKKQDDRKSLSVYYLTVVRYNALLIYPIMMVLILFAEPFLFFFFGDKWGGAIRPLQILSVSVVFHMMVSSNSSLIRGMGKPGLEFRLQLFKSLVLYLPLISVGTFYFGTQGAAWAILVNKVISVFIAQHFLKKLLGIDFYQLFDSVKVALLGLLGGLLIGFLLYKYLGLMWVLACVCAFLTYFSIVYLYMKEELLRVLKLFKTTKLSN